MTPCASAPNATASTSAHAIATPATTPRIEKRELSVITGIASHESAATRGPPSSHTAPAIVSSLPTQAANIRYSGRVHTGHQTVRGAKHRATRESGTAAATSPATATPRRSRPRGSRTSCAGRAARAPPCRASARGRSRRGTATSPARHALRGGRRIGRHAHCSAPKRRTITVPAGPGRTFSACSAYCSGACEARQLCVRSCMRTYVRAMEQSHARGGGAAPSPRLPRSRPPCAASTHPRPSTRASTRCTRKSVLNRVPESSRMPFRWTINPYRGCSHACIYCSVADTRVLMADGRTIPHRRPRGGGPDLRHRARRVIQAVRALPSVLDKWSSIQRAYAVTLRDGTELIASGEHRFLT